MDDNLEASDEIRDYNVANNKSKKNHLETDLIVQPPAENPKMDAGSIETLSEGNANRKKKKRLRMKKKKATIKDEVQSMDQTKMDPASTENLAKGNATDKRKGERKCIKKAKIKDEVQSMDHSRDYKVANNESEKKLLETDLTVQPLDKNPKMDAGSSLAEGNVTGKRKRKRKSIKKAKIRDEVQSMDQTRDYKVANDELEKNLLKTDLTVQPLAENPKMDAVSIETLSEGNANRKKKKRMKRNKKKAAIKDEVQSMGQAKLDPGSTENLGEGNVTGKIKRKRKSIKKAKIEDEVQSMDQVRDYKVANNESEKNLLETDLTVQLLAENPKMDVGSIETLSEGNANRKKKKRLKRNKKKATIKDDVQSMDQTKMDPGSTENLAEGNVTGKRKRKRKSIKKAKLKDEAQSTDQIRDYKVANNELAENLQETDLTVQPVAEIPKMDAGSIETHTNQPKMDTGSTENFAEGNVTAKNKTKGKGSKKKKNKGSAEGSSVFSTWDVEDTTHFSSRDMKDAVCLYLKTAPSISIRRKLLVLDVNGLLADIVMPAPKYCRGHIHISGRAIFRRPLCDDFLKFCFQNFDVGIWSSRSKRIINKVVNYLLGDLKSKLLFCWNMTHCTQTGFKTLENRHKPLVCKELRKVWENDDPNLPWKKGDYNESNTLLLDDSPYKALLNPLHTAIFPYSYRYVDKNDNSLGPEGDLRVYLKALVTSENVQKYVEQHPFGQRAINEKNSNWGFYAQVLHQMSDRLNDKSPGSVLTLS